MDNWRRIKLQNKQTMSVQVNYPEDPDELGTQREIIEVFKVELINNHGNIYHPGQYVEGHVTVQNRQTVSIRGNIAIR